MGASLTLVLAGCVSPAATPPAPEFLLLGEVHDNAAHHQLRAERLASLLADGQRTTVVFEQLPTARDADLAAQQQRAPADVEALIDAGQWDRRAWRWPLHQPVVTAAVTGGAAVRGGNLAREEVRRLMREGDAAWPPALLALSMRTPWADAQQRAALKAIDDGHCGALPAAMHEPMVQAQRARDASLAQAMLAARAAGATRVVLIAGNGHVDRELGVPRYLEAAGVAPARIHAVGYVEAGQGGAGRFDERVETPGRPTRGPLPILEALIHASRSQANENHPHLKLH